MGRMNNAAPTIISRCCRESFVTRKPCQSEAPEAVGGAREEGATVDAVLELFVAKRCVHITGGKDQDQSSKNQAPRSRETLNTKHQHTRHEKSGAWILMLLWSLDLGAWSLFSSFSFAVHAYENQH